MKIALTTGLLLLRIVPQGGGGREDHAFGGCHTVRHSHRSTMATRIKGQSEKEREGHSDNDWTVSFLCLPFLILGGGAVEYGVLHDDTVVDK